MELLTPGTGLIFWQAVVFLGLFFLLSKLAWKPILTSLKEREVSIQNALDSAEKAKEEMATLKAGNEKLLKEAREERDKILREARDGANRIHDDAQEDAKKNANRMIEDAKAVIQSEKQAAMKDVRETGEVVGGEGRLGGVDRGGDGGGEGCTEGEEHLREG